MANEKEVFGLPKIVITFKTKSTTAIARSARGVGVMILNDSHMLDDDGVESWQLYRIEDTDDVPSTGIDERNADLINKALLGTPLRLLVYLIPPASKTVTKEVTTGEGDDAVTETVTETVDCEINQSTILKEVADSKWNYICHPTGKTSDQSALSGWVVTYRNNHDKSFKAIVAKVPTADHEGVINFTTGGITIENPDWLDAYEDADGDETQIPATIPHYLTYTAAEYTARIMGILCGLSLDRSATYYELGEVVKCDAYDDINSNINNGELCLFDEKDGNGVKIARACNSLHTFTTDKGQDFRYIKIVEAIDMIHDDIGDTFREEYVGKVINSYNNKMLFIAAIHVYFNGLKGNVLDASPSVNNYVEIDTDKHLDWAALHSIDTTNWSDQRIRELNTGTNVFLRGVIHCVNAMEDLTLNFTIE